MRVKDFPSIELPRDSTLKEARVYVGLKGWMLTHLFCKCYTGEVQNKTVYFNKKSLVRHLCDIKLAKTDLSKVKNNSVIQRRVLEILQPIVGKPILLQQINDLFQEFQKAKYNLYLSPSTNTAEFIDHANKTLATIKLRLHQRVIKKYDAEELKKILEPGDILFRKIPEDMQNNIVTAQKIQRYILSGFRETEAYKFSHAAMYVGEDEDGVGRIAEAAWPSGKKDEMRSLRLDDPRFALEEGEGREYWVVKPLDRALGQRAAEKAKLIVTELPLEANSADREQKTVYRYTIFGAAKSLWHTSRFDFVAKYRYMKLYHDHVVEGKPRAFMSKENFFCSYFVSYCYQAAEAVVLLPTILKGDDKAIRGHTKFGKAVFRDLWARARRWKHFGELDQQVKMRYDAKMTSPQDFRNFVVSKNQLFKESFVIQSPQKRS